MLTKNGPTKKGLVKTIGAFGENLLVMIIVLYTLTRKYPLRGYILGVLTHATAWDQLWGGDNFLRMYIRCSASPCTTAV